MTINILFSEDESLESRYNNYLSPFKQLLKKFKKFTSRTGKTKKKKKIVYKILEKYIVNY